MEAVILVGGQGTRLRPLTLSTPKQMLPIMGIPMIEAVLRQLARHGVTEAVFSLGYLPDAFLEAYPDGHCAGVSLHYAVEPEPLDTAGAVRFAAEVLEPTETFVVVNGDVLTDLNLTELVGFHKASGAQGTIALHPVEDPSQFGVVPTKDDGQVIEFVEKPGADAPTNLINAGTYVFEPSVLERLPLGIKTSIERKTFPEMVVDGALFAMADSSYWLDAGTPKAYLQAHADFLSGRRTSDVYDARLSNSSYLIEGCHVDSAAIITSSVIDRGCVVEAGATIIDSVLLPGTIVRSGARIEGSILGARSEIGASAVIGPTTVIGFDEIIEAGARFTDARVPS